MLFRTVNGELVEINRYSFKNDKMYYEKIMEIKNQIISKNQSSKLYYWNNSKEFESEKQLRAYIESIIERKMKSRVIGNLGN